MCSFARLLHVLEEEPKHFAFNSKKTKQNKTKRFIDLYLSSRRKTTGVAPKCFLVKPDVFIHVSENWHEKY